jgi:hypothetical protein
MCWATGNPMLPKPITHTFVSILIHLLLGHFFLMGCTIYYKNFVPNSKYFLFLIIFYITAEFEEPNLPGAKEQNTQTADA